MFKDRIEAGRMLAEKLEGYRGTDGIVFALPRGGVVLGFEIARALSFPLDVITTRKIGHPQNPEYAIGAVDSSGMVLLNESEARSMDRDQLESEIEKERLEARRREALYRGRTAAPRIRDKIVILVDDGVATGFTIRLAIRALKKGRPAKIVVAIPCAPRRSLDLLEAEGADEIVSIETPVDFRGSVGAHYLRFDEVTDAEVVEMMRGSKERRSI